MKILIVSDTHGELDPRIAELSGRCDSAVHAGDIMNAQVLRDLRPRGGAVHAVRGNNDVPDKWPDDEGDELARLPEEIVVDLPGGALQVVHGHRIWDTRNYHARLRRKYPDARAIVFGHTHHQARDLETEPWVLNPGAAGRIRNHGGPSCLILHATRRVWRVEPVRFHPE